MESLAARAIVPSGSELKSAAIDASEDMADEYGVRAPVEVSDLRGSGHPTVTDDGAKIHDRPPHVHRLSKEELKAKHEVLGLFHIGNEHEGRFS